MTLEEIAERMGNLFVILQDAGMPRQQAADAAYGLIMTWLARMSPVLGYNTPEEPTPNQNGFQA